jgi:uncharacterized protein involved in outer membrane biogenesis
VSRRRALLLGVGIGAAVVAVGVLVLVSRLDELVQGLIERRAAALTGTPVHVESVEIALASGRASVRGLTVANPPGFTSPALLSLQAVEVDIDVRSLFADPLVIDAIHIVAPHVFYEENAAGTANIDVIRRRVESRRGEPDRDAAAVTPAARRDGDTDGRKLIIHLLELRQGEVTFVGAGGQRTEELPPFELTAIGVKQGGATPAEVGRIILVAVARDVAVALAADQLQQVVGKHVGGLLGDIVKKGGAGAIEKGLGDLLDKMLGGKKGERPRE